MDNKLLEAILAKSIQAKPSFRTGILTLGSCSEPTTGKHLGGATFFLARKQQGTHQSEGTQDDRSSLILGSTTLGLNRRLNAV